MMKTLEDDFGIEVIHAWGMTEMSPLGTLSRLKAKHESLDADAKHRILEKQGKVIFGVDMAIIDDDGKELPWNAKDSGNLVVRGPWVIRSYFQREESPLIELDGQQWFPTGDVAAIDPDAYMQITDRSKDVIKSGGEWISSIDLENIAMAHPAVHEAAAIACRHPKWDERPLLVVVKKPDASRDARPSCSHFSTARSPNGRFPTTSRSSTNCRIPRPARSRSSSCASSSRTTNCRAVGLSRGRARRVARVTGSPGSP